MWEPVLQELGIVEKTPHTTRHTLATKLDEVEKYDKLRNKKNSTDTQHKI